MHVSYLMKSKIVWKHEIFHSASCIQDDKRHDWTIVPFLIIPTQYQYSKPYPSNITLINNEPLHRNRNVIKLRKHFQKFNISARKYVEAIS